MADKTLRIIVEGQDKGATKTLTGLEKNLKGLEGAIGTFKKIGAAAVVMGATIDKAFDIGYAGAQTKRLEASGDELAASLGGNYDDIIQALDEASLNTVSQTDLMTAANRAMMLQLGADAGQLADLMQVAAFRGRAMGLDTTQAFSDIVTGVGRMSPMILDNLGIVIDAERRYQDYAAAQGISADAIDATTKKQILLNGVLEEGTKMIAEAGGLALDEAASYERMRASIKDLGDEIMRSLSKPLADAADALYLLLTWDQQVDDAIVQHEKDVRKSAGSWEEYSAEMERAIEVAGYQVTVTEDQIRVMQDNGMGAVTTSDQFDLYTKSIWEAVEADEELAFRLNQVGYGMEVIEDATPGAAQTVEDLALVTALAADKFLRVQEAAAAAKSWVSQFAGSIDGSISALDRLNSMELNFGSKIKTQMDKIEWEQLGGEAIQRAYDQINLAIEDGLSPEDAKAAFAELLAVSETVQADVDDISVTELAKKIQGELGGSLEAATAKALEIREALAAGALEEYVYKITFEYGVTGTTGKPTTGGLPAIPGMPKPDGATGLTMTVPPGYLKDTYPIYAKSGETVSITPNLYERPSAAGGVVNLNLSIGQLGSGAQDAHELAWELAEEIGRSL